MFRVSREQWMAESLTKRKYEGTLRKLRTAEADKCFVDFTSNDYLGLGRSEELGQSVKHEEAIILQEIRRRRQQRQASHTTPIPKGFVGPRSDCDFPVFGSSGSRLLSGNSWYAEELEKWTASFHCREAALLFNSGYDANLSLMSCLPRPGDLVVCDELVHNSMRMGCRLGRQADTVFFRHNDVGHLGEVLSGFQSRREVAVASNESCNAFVAVESVYSMDGDLAPLADILDACEAHGAMAIVDEAHGTGVFGPQGRGLVAALGLEHHPALLAEMHSFGKGLGVHGAVVVGSDTLRSYLINYARPLIYSTSLPLHSLVSIKCAYVMQASADTRRQRLFALVDKFRSALLDGDDAKDETSPLGPRELLGDRSPIQSVVVSGNERCLDVSEALRSLGFDVRAIRKPTVAEGTERLRITLHAHNTDLEVESLAHHIRRLVAKLVTEGRRREGEAMEASCGQRGAMASLERVANLTSRARL